jgi:hypothetical protein
MSRLPSLAEGAAWGAGSEGQEGWWHPGKGALRMGPGPGADKSVGVKQGDPEEWEKPSLRTRGGSRRKTRRRA